jgi:hypothetical protein
MLPKSADVFCNQLIGRSHLTIAWPCYLLLCLCISILARFFQSLFKAQAFKYEGTRKDSNSIEAERRESYGRIYWKYLSSFKLKKHSDLFLPTFIGFIELAAYPVLFVVGQYLFIGAWLGIKTAGSWRGWQTSGTAYNRFLLFNLFNLLLAYLFLTRFVQRIPCP